MKDRAFRPPEERYDDTVLRRVIAWVGVGALVAAAGVVAVMVTADGEEVAPPPSADPSVALPAAVDAGFLLTGEISLQAEAFSETETGCSGTGPYSLVGPAGPVALRIDNRIFAEGTIEGTTAFGGEICRLSYVLRSQAMPDVELEYLLEIGGRTVGFPGYAIERGGTISAGPMRVYRFAAIPLGETVAAGAIDPVGITIGGHPVGLALGAGSIWVIDDTDDVVRRVSPITGTVEAVIPIGPAPTAVAVGAGSVWVADRTESSLYRVDPNTAAVHSVIQLQGYLTDVVVSAGRVWIGADGGRVFVVDPMTDVIVTTVTVPTGMLATAGDSVWSVGIRAFPTLSHLDAADGSVLGQVQLAGVARGIAAGPGGAWLVTVNGSDDRVVHVDSASVEIAAAHPVIDARAVALGPRDVWVARPDAGRVTLVDAGGRGVLEARSIGGAPSLIAASDVMVVAADTDAGLLWLFRP